MNGVQFKHWMMDPATHQLLQKTVTRFSALLKLVDLMLLTGIQFQRWLLEPATHHLLQNLVTRFSSRAAARLEHLDLNQLVTI